MRLIDADALKKLWCEDCDNKHFCNEEIYCDSVKQLYEQPTVDVVKHGHWTPHPDPRVREWDVCSSCGIGCKRREYEDGWETQYNYPFCPNCGAKMDEVEDAD